MRVDDVTLTPELVSASSLNAVSLSSSTDYSEQEVRD